jgi:hypothetical protein
LYLIADISKTNPYVNEPITVVYKLYFSNNIGINNLSEVKPKYNDFGVKTLILKNWLPECLKARIIVISYLKAVLYPQKSGKLTIEPLSMDVDAVAYEP